jgi:GNAT superfamily N-acetyltransferase
MLPSFASMYPNRYNTTGVSVHVRTAEPKDAAAACEVLRRSITELCEADHRNDEAFLARWLANKTPENVTSWMANGPMFVAEDAGRIVGVAALSKTGHVTLNYVAPEARFKGVSKALLSAVERRAGELGCTMCTLQSTKTAERFYRAAGYGERAGLPEGVLGKTL